MAIHTKDRQRYIRALVMGITFDHSVLGHGITFDHSGLSHGITFDHSGLSHGHHP